MLDAARKRGVVPGVREHPALPEKFRVGPYCDFDYAMNETEIGDVLRQCASGIHGSVHLLPGRVHDVDWPKGAVSHYVLWDLSEDVFIAHLRDRKPKQLLHDYFGIMTDLVATNFYNALSHIDLIRKFDRLNASGQSIYFNEVESLYMELSRGVVERISRTPMAIEINTAGLCAPVGRPYITQELLNYAVELGVPICLGSDAHMPERVGAHLDVALKMLECAGRDWLVTFKDRQIVRYDWA